MVRGIKCIIRIVWIFSFLNFITIMHFQEEDVVSHIGKILKIDRKKFGLRHKPDVTGKLRTELRHLAQENRLKVSDIKCLLV
jgi:hypothetical protein